VLKALGKGSYGTVYKVQRLEDGGVYAMKETDLGRMGPKERQDAVNEIRVLGSMNHPNVVRHHETFVSGEAVGMRCSADGSAQGYVRQQQRRQQ
jgi:NIMA (never in mitosis gene a)-related kinase